MPGASCRITTTSGSQKGSTFNYNLSGTLELQSEDLPDPFYGTRRITYPRATTGVIGRPTGLQLGTSSSPTADQGVTYGYQADGRVSSIAGGGQTFAYAYTANSHLIATVTNSAASYTDTRVYDAAHDWTDSRATTIGAVTKAAFSYGQDVMGRIGSNAKTGEVFNRYGNGTEGLKTVYDYNDRSELTIEQTKIGTSATVLTGRNDAYAYDNIGNRSSTAGTTHNGNTASYTTNALNQYTSRTVPGIFDVAGSAASAATVTVNGSNAGVTRHGDYFFKGQSMANNPNAVFSTLAISDGTTTANLAAFLQGTPEPMSYDDDGNLLSDGRWDYTFDAENRLVSAQTHTALSPSILPNADARRLEFKYDYLGRRTQKTVRAGWNGSSYTTVVSDEKFVWSGWSMLARLNAASGNALIASYYWGLDLSGSLQGAGGVGGLLLIQDSGQSYLPAYDAMGNLHVLIKASDGSLAAAYEFDAFGNTLRESGTYAASNPFRYSTKFTDTETNLIYYGLRYYSPALGRFINKDPISESGGLNLYGYCGNNGVNGWDMLGCYEINGQVGNVFTFTGDPDPTWTTNGVSTVLMDGNGNFYVQGTGAGGGGASYNSEIDDFGWNGGLFGAAPSYLDSYSNPGYIDQMSAQVSSMVAYGQRVHFAIDVNADLIKKGSDVRFRMDADGNFIASDGHNSGSAGGDRVTLGILVTKGPAQNSPANTMDFREQTYGRGDAESTAAARNIYDALKRMTLPDGSPTEASKRIAIIENSGFTAAIYGTNEKMRNAYTVPILYSGDPTGGYVLINPREVFQYGGPGRGLYSNPLAVMAHELTHLADFIQSGYAHTYSREFEAVRVENQILNLIGFPALTHYGKVAVPDYDKYIPKTSSPPGPGG